MKTRTWILILAAAALISGAACLFLLFGKSGGQTAQVIQDGEILCEIDLSTVGEPYTFTVTGKDGGVNVIEVEPGRIRVSEADCPDRICVHQGWLSTQSVPVVCVPHRLMIRLVSGTGPDAYTG
ncbi:MAG: NusG domain II-containing protein [Clostridia bacterium]|nr:NusG domain II-containing protein [Clostridia bacterium]